MKNIQETRRDLWHSMDMTFVKLLMFWTFLFTMIVSVTMLLSSRGMDTHERVAVIGIIMAIAIGPILIVCAWRTFRTFQAAESYIFCKTKLSNPMGGRFRDSIKFRVLLEDADGYPFHFSDPCGIWRICFGRLCKPRSDHRLQRRDR